MPRFGSIKTRNHGWGRRLLQAGVSALRDHFGHGHQGSMRAHGERWRSFAKWLREVHDIDDARKVTREHIVAYGCSLQERGLKTSTIQNHMSTINVVFETLRTDSQLRVSPSAIAGRRSTVRRTVPATLSEDVYAATVRALDTAGHWRAATTLMLGREMGMRRREAVLMDVPRLHDEHIRYGYYNVQQGTKGGRRAPRWVATTGRAESTVRRAMRQSLSHNLLRADERFRDFLREAGRARRTLHRAGVPGYHDARAAYACARYFEITGSEAPVVAGERRVTKGEDRSARKQLAYELGHGRIDVMRAYVGSAA